MKSLLLLLTLLPLAFSQVAKVETSQASKVEIACNCAPTSTDCPDIQLDIKAADKCAQPCGQIPQVPICPSIGQGRRSTTLQTITATPVPEPTAFSDTVSVEPTTTSSIRLTTKSSINSTTTSSIEPTTVPSENPAAATVTPLPGPQKCGAFVDTPCPSDQSCVPDPATPGCQDCSGICVPPQRCGSRGLKSCPEGRFCVNDPNDPFCSTAFDCPGYCVLLDGNDCSNEFGIACPSSQQVCVDDLSDDCFPGEGLVCLQKCTFLNGRSSAGFLEE